MNEEKNVKIFNVKLITEFDPETFKPVRRTFSWKPQLPVISLANTPNEEILKVMKKKVEEWKQQIEKTKPIADRIQTQLKKSEQEKKLSEAEKKIKEKTVVKEDINKSALFGSA